MRMPDVRWHYCQKWPVLLFVCLLSFVSAEDTGETQADESKMPTPSLYPPVLKVRKIQLEGIC